MLVALVDTGFAVTRRQANSRSYELIAFISRLQRSFYHQHPEMLGIDLTYNVDVFSMPLMQIVAIDGHRVGRCIFFALVNSRCADTGSSSLCLCGIDRQC